VDTITDEAEARVKAGKVPEGGKDPLTPAQRETVETLLKLLYCAREVERQMRESVTGTNYRYPPDEWNGMIHDTDVTLHDFRFRTLLLENRPAEPRQRIPAPAFSDAVPSLVM
jgi:hypothetical protein